MTVDTVVKIVESEKCGLDMSSYEDLHSSDVGGGGTINGNNDNVSSDCNGDGKDDYVFVNGSDVAASSNDHVENHAKLTADGDVNVKDNVNVVDVVEEESRVDNGVNLGEENREIESRSEDVVVDVASSNDHVENHAKVSVDGEVNVDVVEEESEVDNSGNLGEENREIDSRSKDVVVDVASSNDHVENHAKLSADGEINVDVVEEESKVDNGVNLGEENREIESRSEDVAVDAASSNDHVENHAKLSADGEVNVDAVEEESKVDNGVNLGEENREIESRSDGVVVDGISSDVNGDSVEESGVDEVKESDDLNDVADEVKEDESVFESGDNGNAAVDSRDFDVDENNKSSVFDGQEVAEVKEEESVEGNGVADVSEPSEIESGIHDAVTEVAEVGLEAERHDIATCETERDMTENNGVVPTVDVPVTELKSESLEMDVSDPSVENGLAEARSLAGEVKDEGLQLDVAAAEEHSFDNQQLHVAPAEGENEKRDSIEVGAKTEQLGVMDPSAGEESRESVVSEVAVSGESMVSNLGSKPEETTEDESLPNQSEGAESVGNQEIDVPAKENRVPIIALESDESETVPTNGVEENGTAVAAADAQFGATDKSGLEDESELIDGEGEGESEVTGEIGGSQESSPGECVLHNQVAEQTQSFDVVDENISSEDYVSEKDPTLQDATNLSEQQSVEQTGSSDVVDEKISSEDCSSERNLTSEDTTNLSEQQFEEQTGSTGVVVEKTSSEDCSVEKNLTSEETNLSEQQSADNTAVDVDQSDDGGSHSKDDVSENKVVPASVESSEDAASELRSEDEGMKLDSVEEVPPPSDVDNLNKREVTGDVSSAAADNLSSGTADDTSSQTKLETDNDSSPSPVADTNSETKTVKAEIVSAIKSNNVSDETVKPNISFGSFGDDLMNKSTAVSADNGEALLHSAVNGDHPEAAQPEQIDNVSASSAEGSEIETSEVQNNSNPDLVRRPFCWLVKVPRFDEGKYKDQLRQGEIELAEKTKTRDGFQAEFSKQQAYCRELKSIRDAANTEVKAARELVWAKTREIDTAHSILNLARHAVTVEDIDNKIHNLEHTLQHQTLNNLKEEKELVREIKQLNLQRQKLTANPQRQQEVQQALSQRGETEEQLKVLKKELDGLRDNLSKADELFRAAKKKHDDEIMILNDIKQQLKSADDIRQEAYAHLKTIQKQLNEKNAPFYKAKNDLRVAYNYATAGKRDNLERHCVNQVEKLMEMWNKNDEFRKEYIQCNMRRTVWKFGTLDGTRLGINEVPPSLGNVSDNRVKTPTKVDAAAVTFTMDRDFPVQAKNTEVKPLKKVEQKVAPPAKAVEAKPPVIIEIEEEVTETPKLTKEEEELARKAEQLRKEEEAARLREQRRLEEKAKAEEALERKRRNALKAQARAEFKARKEAEEKEKEREKRAKKKGKKKGIISETTENEPAQPSEPSSKVAKEREIVEKPARTTKKTQKVGLHSKPIKTTKPIPPALRSKGKRGLLRYWPYACVVLLAIALFYLGSYERIQAIKQFISGLFN